MPQWYEKILYEHKIMNNQIEYDSHFLLNSNRFITIIIAFFAFRQSEVVV